MPRWKALRATWKADAPIVTGTQSSPNIAAP
jgi:hypothetical protein